MGSAIQRGSREPVEARAWLKWPPLAATGTPLKECQWQASGGGPGRRLQVWGHLHPDHRLNVVKCLWLRLENSTPSNIKPAPIKFDGTLNCRAYSMELAL